MVGFVLALLASISWGVSDFLGGLETRTAALPVVLAISQTAGMVVLVAALLVHGEPLPHDGRLWYAVGAGLASLAGLGLLYSAMARGSIAVVAPVGACGAVLPVLVGLAQGDPFGWASGLGMVLALVGAAAAAWEPGGLGDRRSSLTGAALALGSAVGIGLFFTLVEAASRSDPYWAPAIARTTACVAILGYLMVRRPGGAGPGGGWALIALIGIGVTDSASEVLFSVATTVGDLGVVAVLSSIYPVVTVALALVILRERMRPYQAWAAASALAGIVLLGYATS